MRRAITLAGGGPAAGLHIGVLSRLAEEGIKFDGDNDVWALSCIGAWVGMVYNQCEPGKRVEQTYEFFKNGVFRDDLSYSHFPVNKVFGPDWSTNIQALQKFLINPKSYTDLFLPTKLPVAFQEVAQFLSDPARWTEGDLNYLTFNNLLAINPLARFFTSMVYLSELTGLTKILYPGSRFLDSIDINKLFEAGPFAFNLTENKLELFCNRTDAKLPVRDDKPAIDEKWALNDYKLLSRESLCACSALPYIEQTVEIEGKTYCEGALVDTVNFKSLIEHHDLDEIWVCRIVDAKQIRQPKNLADALSNLCQLFAATVGEDDVRLFEYHVREENNWKGTIIEIQVDSNINFEWSHSNIKSGFEKGRFAAAKAYEKYKAETCLEPNKTGRVKIISDPMPKFDVFDPELRDCEHKLASALKAMDDLKAQLATARDEIKALQKKR